MFRMEKDDQIVYEDLKIKNFNDVVIPEPFQLLYEAETHYFNLNLENFEDTVKFYQKFITDGPGETQEDNFKYLLELFTDGELIETYTDNLHFQMIQTLNNIFKPTIKAKGIEFYDMAVCAGINVEFSPKVAEKYPKPEMRERKPPSESKQIILSDDVSKFQQHFDKSEPIYYYRFLPMLFDKPSINIIKYLLINNDFDDLTKFSRFELIDFYCNAIKSGNLEIIRLFEQKGIKYDNCLSDAFKSRNSDLITWLLENYQQKKVNRVRLSNIKSILFCLENNLCLDYYNLIFVYYESKFKTILEYMVKYNDGLLQVEHDISLDKADANRSIIADCLQNKRYDYFNILFDLGLCYFNGNFQNPLSYLVYYDVSDLDLYEKVYQMTQRSSHARFELLDYAFPKILSNMDLLKFFVERKIYDPQLEDIMVYCGVEEMKYVFDQNFHLKKFNEIFADRGNLCFKPELIFYIVRNYQVKLEDKNGFNLMKNAFYHAHIELMKFLLDKYVMLTCKDKNDFYDFNKRYNWNRYYGQESKEENYDEEFDDPKFIFYNVMDNSIHTNIEAFELILENGGNANARGKDGFKTILDYHAYEGHFEIVKILAEHGAKITETTFEKCKDYNSFYCLIDNAKTNWLSNNLIKLFRIIFISLIPNY